MYAGLLSLLFVHLMVILPQSTAIILAIFLASSVMMLFMNSGAEIAFFSIGYKDLNNLRSKKYPGSERILTLLKEPKQLMSSMLVGNMVLRLLIVLLCNYLIR
jgi:Mg2+/Co2+ transporter CorB